MNKERKPEERMNQGPPVPEQIGNLQKTKKKTLILKMLDAFLIALLVLSSVIVVVSMFVHHISAMFTKLLAEKTEPKPYIGGVPAVPRGIHEPFNIHGADNVSGEPTCVNEEW